MCIKRHSSRIEPERWRRALRIAAVPLGLLLPILLLAAQVGCSRGPANASSASGAAGPRTAANPNAYEHDFGDVISGATLSHVFSFRNSTEYALRLDGQDSVSHSCGCLSVVADQSTVPSGTAIDIPVSMAGKGRLGKFRESTKITWTTDAGDKVTSTFTLHGNCLPGIEVEPTFWRFDGAPENFAAERVFVATSKYPIDWNRVNLVSKKPEFQVTRGQVGDNGLEFTVRCALPSDQAFGDGAVLLLAPLREETNGLTEVSAKVDLAATREIRLSVFPKTLLLRDSSGTDDPAIAAASLFLKGTKVASLGERCVSSVSVENLTAQIKWELVTRSRDLAELRVRMEWKGDSSGKEGMLVVQMPDEEVLRVPIWVDHALAASSR